MGSRWIHWCSDRRPSRGRPRWRSRHGCILPVVLPSLLVYLLPAILLSAVLSSNGSTHVPAVPNAMGPRACLRILVDTAEIRVGSTQFTRSHSAELPNQDDGGFASGTEGLERIPLAHPVRSLSCRSDSWTTGSSAWLFLILRSSRACDRTR